MRAVRLLFRTAVVVIVGGLLVSALRANAGERPGPPSGAPKAVAQSGASGKGKAATTSTRSTSSTKIARNSKSTKDAKGTRGTRTTATTMKRRGYDVGTGPITSRQVALTFDDCPRSLAAFKRVAKGAQRLGIGLMLFPTGACLQAGRFSAAYARAHGHHVFNHSVSHADLARLSYGGVLAELGGSAIQSRYGRPPFGSFSPTVARAYRAKGMKMWTWTVDTGDWQGRPQQEVVETAVRTPRAGGTVLMHMQWHGFSVSALKAMQAGLNERGLGTCRNFGSTPVRSWTVRC